MSDLQQEIARLQAALKQAEARAADADARVADADARVADADARVAAADSRIAAAESRAGEAERQLQSTTFLEYLGQLQTTIDPQLVIEPKSSARSAVTATEVANRFYPRALCRWTEFPTLHDQQFDAFAHKFQDVRIFPSFAQIDGNDLSSESRRDEQDIRPFVRAYAERPARRIVNKFIDTHPSFQGIRLSFRNNAYGLHPRPSQDSHDRDSPAPPKRRSPDRITALFPDRWGIRCTLEDEVCTPALVAEYKAAHVTQGWRFREVLGADPLPVDFFARCALGPQEPNPPAGPARAPTPDQRTQDKIMVAKVLCQAYHYMIITGLAYGYVSSGDCMVFLAIPQGSPETLLIHLLNRQANIPDVKQSHAAQLATLSLLALEAELPPAQWIRNAELTLSRWPPSGGNKKSITQVAPSLPPTLPPSANPSSTPSPCRSPTTATTRDNQRHDDEDGAGDHDAGGRGSAAPAQSAATANKRKRSDGEGDCETGDGTAPSSSKGDNNKNNNNTVGNGTTPPYSPPRDSTSTSAGTTPNTRSGMTGYPLYIPPHATKRPYCTQACLLGLSHYKSDNPPPRLDPACPNALLHSGHGQYPSHHRIPASYLCERVKSRLAINLDDGCECLDKYGLFGATGVLFKITDPEYGYVFVAKGVQSVDAAILADEASVYAHCAALQGVRMPVYLGRISLSDQGGYPLRSLAVVSDMMFLSWVGVSLNNASITRVVLPPGVNVDAEISEIHHALARYGVGHDDILDSNLAWNDEVGGIMALDFNRVFYWDVPRKKPRTNDT